MRFLRANAGVPRGERGEVSFIGLAMLLAVAAAGYLAWVWVPVYMLHQDVERVVRETANAAAKNKDDRGLLLQMVKRIQDLERVEVEVEGRRQRVPVVDVGPGDVVWERDPQQLRIAFTYTREVVYPWLERRQERSMAIDLRLDVTPANWDDRGPFSKWGVK